jgi:hypothetical protein
MTTGQNSVSFSNGLNISSTKKEKDESYMILNEKKNFQPLSYHNTPPSELKSRKFQRPRTNNPFSIRNYSAHPNPKSANSNKGTLPPTFARVKKSNPDYSENGSYIEGVNLTTNNVLSTNGSQAQENNSLTNKNYLGFLYYNPQLSFKKNDFKIKITNEKSKANYPEKMKELSNELFKKKTKKSESKLELSGNKAVFNSKGRLKLNSADSKLESRQSKLNLPILPIKPQMIYSPSSNTKKNNNISPSQNKIFQFPKNAPNKATQNNTSNTSLSKSPNKIKLQEKPQKLSDLKSKLKNAFLNPTHILKLSNSPTSKLTPNTKAFPLNISTHLGVKKQEKDLNATFLRKLKEQNIGMRRNHEEEDKALSMEYALQSNTYDSEHTQTQTQAQAQTKVQAQDNNLLMQIGLRRTNHPNPTHQQPSLTHTNTYTHAQTHKAHNTTQIHSNAKYDQNPLIRHQKAFSKHTASNSHQIINISPPSSHSHNIRNPININLPPPPPLATHFHPHSFQISKNQYPKVSTAPINIHQLVNDTNPLSASGSNPLSRGLGFIQKKNILPLSGKSFTVFKADVSRNRVPVLNQFSTGSASNSIPYEERRNKDGHMNKENNLANYLEASHQTGQVKKRGSKTDNGDISYLLTFHKDSKFNVEGEAVSGNNNKNMSLRGRSTEQIKKPPSKDYVLQQPKGFSEKKFNIENISPILAENEVNIKRNIKKFSKLGQISKVSAFKDKNLVNFSKEKSKKEEVTKDERLTEIKEENRVKLSTKFGIKGLNLDQGSRLNKTEIIGKRISSTPLEESSTEQIIPANRSISQNTKYFISHESGQDFADAVKKYLEIIYLNL